MNCLFEEIPGSADGHGRRRFRCTRCPKESGLTSDLPERITSTCRSGQNGVGTELTKLLKSLGIKPDGCAGECARVASEMDALGPAGVRAERQRFRQHLLKAYGKPSTLDVAAITARAVASGLAWKVNPLDVPGSLIELACRRAEEQT